MMNAVQLLRRPRSIAPCSREVEMRPSVWSDMWNTNYIRWAADSRTGCAIDRRAEDARSDLAVAGCLSHELERLDRAGSPDHVHAARQTKRLARLPALDGTHESKLAHRSRERAFGMGMLELDAYKRPGHRDS